MLAFACQVNGEYAMLKVVVENCRLGKCSVVPAAVFWFKYAGDDDIRAYSASGWPFGSGNDF